MKTVIALAILSIIVVVRAEQCQQASDCSMTSCVDSNNMVDCIHHECTCSSGNNQQGGCTNNADCHNHHQTHCHQHGQHAVCMNGSCQCQ